MTGRLGNRGPNLQPTNASTTSEQSVILTGHRPQSCRISGLSAAQPVPAVPVFSPRWVPVGCVSIRGSPGCWALPSLSHSQLVAQGPPAPSQDWDPAWGRSPALPTARGTLQQHGWVSASSRRQLLLFSSLFLSVCLPP